MKILLFYLFEIAEGLINSFNKGEGIIVFSQYGLEFIKLMLVYNAYQH